MSFRSFLRYLGRMVKGETKRKPKRARERRSYRLGLEALEKREMPAVDIPFIVQTGVRPVDGSTTPTGTPVIQVQYSEAMTLSAADAANYKLTSASGLSVLINSVVLDSTSTVATIQYNNNQPLIVDTYTLFVQGNRVFDQDDGLPLAQDPQFIISNVGQNNISIVSLPDNGALGAQSLYALSSPNARPENVALGDFDGDLLPDLVVVDPQNNQLALFKGKTAATGGGFALTPDLLLNLPSGSRARHLVITDLNNDNKKDIAVSNSGTDNVSVLLNTSTVVGTLSFNLVNVTVDDEPAGIAAADLDGDGNVDLVTAHRTASTNIGGTNDNDFRIDVLRGNGDWTDPATITITRVIVGDVVPSGLQTPQDVAIGQFNADTIPDIVVGGNIQVRLIVNNSTSGTFAFAVQAGSIFTGASQLAAADLDSGSLTDLAVGMTNNQVVVLRNMGGGTFTNLTFTFTGANATRVAAGDLNGDRKSEVVAVNFANNGQLAAFRNGTVGGTISGATNTPGTDIVITSKNHGLSTGNRVVITGVAGNTAANGTHTITRVDDDRFSLNGVSGNGAYTGGGTWVQRGAITGATGNTVSPIVITSAAHGLTTGARVTITGVGGNTAANGTFTITRVDSDKFSLNGTTGNGDYTSGGVWVTEFWLEAAPGSPYGVGGVPFGVTLGDINQDGKLDVVTANSVNDPAPPGTPRTDDVSVLVGRGDGTFFVSKQTALTPAFTTPLPNPVGSSLVATGDLNGDNQPDIVTVNRNLSTSATFVQVFLNAGGGTYAAAQNFSPAVAGQNMRDLVSVAIADLNNDGKPDIAVLDRQDNSVGILRNNTATGSQTAAFVAQPAVGVGVGPNHLIFADVNSDGKLDMLVGITGPTPGTTGAVSRRLGNGNFTFGALQTFDGEGIGVGHINSIVAVDWDKDGDLDLIGAEDFLPSGWIDWWKGDGTGQFDYINFASASLNRGGSIVAGDFNGDSFIDVVITSLDATAGGMTYFQNQAGTGFLNAFSHPVLPNVALQQVIAQDLNQDGKLDLIITTQSGNNNVVVMTGNGNGTFNNPVPYLAGNTGSTAGPSFIAAAGSSPLLKVTTFESGGNLVNPNIVANSGFEEKDLTGEIGNVLGWRTFKLPDNPGGSHGAWTAQTGTISPLSNTVVPAPVGKARAMLDQQHLQPINGFFAVNPASNYSGSHALYQDIFIPAGVTQATLSLSLYIDNRGSSSGYSDNIANPILDYRTTAPNQQVRVDLVSAQSGEVTFASNASPIVITSAGHTLTTGQQILLTGVRGNTAANGTWTVTVIDADRFSLNGSTGNGAYAGDGKWTVPLMGVTPAQGVLRNLFRTTQTDSPIQNVTVTDNNLTAFAGRTIRLRIATTNNRGLMIVGVEDAKITTLFNDSVQPELSGLRMRNPGFFGNPGGTTPHTTDPTIVGQISDNGGLKNIKFVAFDVRNNGFGNSDDLRLTQWDSTGTFTMSLPNVAPGLHTIGVRVQDRANNVRDDVISFFMQGDSVGEWQALGPNPVDVSSVGFDFTRVSGRITAIVPDLGDPLGNTYFIGSANGGVWKTTNGGKDWQALTDKIMSPTGAPLAVPIGGLAQSRSEPKIVYAGTGVGDRELDSRPGVGILKSADGGKTWGLAGNSGAVLGGARITKMVVDSNDPNIAYAAVASGGSAGPGVYRTLNGGTTWTNMLIPTQMLQANGQFLPPGTPLASVTDLIIDPFNSNRLLVALGNVGLVGASATAGVWRTINKGESWDQIVGGDAGIANSTLPTGIGLGRVTLGMGSGRVGDERFVYVLIGNPPGNNTPPSVDFGTFQGLFKSKNNLLNFTKVMLKEDVPIPGGTPHRFIDIGLSGRDSANTGALIVDPSNPNVVYVGGSSRWTRVGDPPQHAFIRVDTGYMRDAEFIYRGTIPNDGDDPDKFDQARFNGLPGGQPDYDPRPGDQGDPYRGEGVYWYDLIQDSSGFSGFGSILPEAITSLAFDAQGRLLVGTPLGIWRGVNRGFDFDFSSGGTGVLAGFVFFDAPGMEFTSLNGNLQISDVTSVAVNPLKPNTYYTTQIGTGGATSTRPQIWTTQNMFGPTVLINSFPVQLAIPNAGAVLATNPPPGAPADTPVTLFRLWQFASTRALKPEISADEGLTWSTAETPGIPISNNPARVFPAFAANPEKVFESGQFQDELLFGTDKVFITRTSGAVWDPLSTTLSTQGGLLTAVAFAPSQTGVYYAGSDLGEVFNTLNNGADSFPLRADFIGPVNGITVDPRNHRIAYVLLGGSGDAGHVWKTTDAGATWNNVSSSLPNVPAYTLIIDTRPGLGTPNGKIYVSTDVGVFTSRDDGATWQPLGLGLPNVPVVNMSFSRQQETLAVATFGRGVYIINTSPMSKIADQTIDEDTSTGPIPFSVNDPGLPPGQITVTASSSNQVLVPNANIVLAGTGIDRTITINPALNRFGTTTITLTVNAGTFSFQRQFNVTVLSVNDVPTVSAIANQATGVGQPVGPLPFTIGDVETPIASLTVTATSNNQTLVPNANISLGGTGANRTITVTPAPSQSGTALITISVSDTDGGVGTSSFAVLVNTAVTLPFSDAFNRLDNPFLGAGWVDDVVGDFVVEGNQAVGKQGLNIALVNGVSEANVTLQAQVFVSAGKYAGLIARHSGPADSNMYFGGVVSVPGGFQAMIWKNFAGGWTLLKAGPTTATGTGTLRFEVVGPSLKLFFNNALAAFTTDNSITAAGALGLRSSDGIRLDDFSADRANLLNPTLPFSDGFDQANGSQLNRNWVEQLGNFTIQNNAAVSTSGLGIATLNGISETNVSAQANLVVPDGKFAGLVTRYQGPGDTNMYWGGLVNRGGGKVEAAIWRNSAGGWTLLSSQPVTVTGTADLRFETVGPSLKLFLANTLVASASDNVLTGPGTIGLRVAEGATVESFSADRITLTDATLPFADPFNETANQQLSSNWLEREGNFKLQGGTAQGNGGLNIATVNGISQSDVFAEAEVALDSGEFAGVIARYTGPGDSNMIFGGLSRSGGSADVAIWRNSNGVWTRLDGQTVPTTGSAVVRLEVVGSSIKLFVDGTLMAFANDSAVTGPGTIGIRTSFGASLNSFNADQLVLTNASLPFTDSFATTSNQQLSSNWLERVGNFRLQGGVAHGNAPYSLATVNGISAANVFTQANVVVPAGGFAGVVARYAGGGDTNMYFAGLIGTGGPNFEVAIWRNANGGWIRLAGQSVGTTSSGLLRFELVGSSLKVFLDGTLRAFTHDAVIAGAGTIGMRVSQNATVDNFASDVLTLTNATLPFSDGFAPTANQQLSSNWFERAGNFNLQGGNATGVNGLNIATVNGISSANVFAQANINVGTSHFGGVVTRYAGSGDTNMYFAGLVNTGNGFEAAIWRNAAGAWNKLAAQAVSTGGSGLVRLEVVGNSLKLFINGTLRAFAQDAGLPAAGTIGLRVSQNVTADNFSADAITLTNVTLPFTDGFATTTDQQLSRNWLEREGNFNLQGGTATGAAGLNLATLNGVSAANVFAEVDIVTLGVGQSVGLVTRYAGPGDTNMYLGNLARTAGGFEASIWRNLGGTWTRIAVNSSVASGAGKLRFETQGTTLRVLLGATLLTSVTDSSISAAGTVGVRTFGGAVIDNFSTNVL